MAASPHARAAYRRYGPSGLSRRLQQSGYGFVAEGTLRETFTGRKGRNPNAPAKVARRADIEAFLSGHPRALAGKPPAGISRQRQSASVLTGAPRFGYPQGSVFVGHFQKPPDSPPDKKWKPVPLHAVRALINRAERYGKRPLNLAIYGRFVYSAGGGGEGVGGGGPLYRFSFGALAPDTAAEWEDSDLEDIEPETAYAVTSTATTPTILATALLDAGADEERRLRFLRRAPTSPEDARDLRAARARERDMSSAVFARRVTGMAWLEVYGVALSPRRQGGPPA